MNTVSPAYTILALETSCDETAAAIVRGGREIIANVVASQIDEHRRYGGIVPEVASRQHILALPTVVDEALAKLPGGWDAIHAVAATNGPGLSGALLTGLNAAKAMAWARELPFVGVNHIEAHIYANWLEDGGRRTEDEGRSRIENRESKTARPIQNPKSKIQNPPSFPLVALVVSGGHTLLVLLEGHGRYRLLGQTRDDAAGEAFDKSARIMGLDFPGGPAIQQAAAGAPGGATLPRAWMRDSYDFSFSGLKTAVLHQIQGRQERESKIATKNLPQRDTKGSGVRGQGSGAKNREPRTENRELRTENQEPADETSAIQNSQSKIQNPPPDRFIAQLAHAFQESVVDVLVTKTINAAREFGATEILLAGGVAANTRLREEMARRASIPVRYPPVTLCTDNAAMVAAAAYFRFEAGVQSGWDLDVSPNLKLG